MIPTRISPPIETPITTGISSCCGGSNVVVVVRFLGDETPGKEDKLANAICWLLTKPLSYGLKYKQ